MAVRRSAISGVGAGYSLMLGYQGVAKLGELQGIEANWHVATRPF